MFRSQIQIKLNYKLMKLQYLIFCTNNDSPEEKEIICSKYYHMFVIKNRLQCRWGVAYL